MEVRLATESEIQHLINDEQLKRTQVHYPNDLVFTARGTEGRFAGLLALRPVYYAHSFITSPEAFGRLFIAERLFNHANGYIEATRRAGAVASGCLFHVHQDNDAMRKFIESKGAVAEPDSILYRYDQITPPKE